MQVWMDAMLDGRRGDRCFFIFFYFTYFYLSSIDFFFFFQLE